MNRAIEQLLRLEPAERARVLDRLGLGDGTEPADELRPLPPDAPRPASFAQEQLWFLTQLAPDVPMYNVPFRFDLDGPLDVEALRRALQVVARRHAVLRSRLEMRDDGLVQIVEDDVGCPVALRDLAGEPDPEAAAADRAEAVVREPFDLARTPLWRAEILRLDPHGRRHVLVWVASHAVVDGWSVGIFLRELRVAYAAERGAAVVPLPPLRLQFADYADWQRRVLRGPRLRALLEHWTQRLDGVEPLDFPTDHPRPSVLTYDGDELVFRIPAATRTALERAAERLGVTPFAVFAAAYVALLGHHARQRDVTIGTPVAARGDAALEGLLGSFVNTVALRVDCGGQPPFAELVRRVADTALDAFAHQELPFGRLVQELSPPRGVAYNPVCQTVFSFGSMPLPDTEDPLADDVTLRLEGVSTRTARFDFEMAVEEWQGALHARFDYNTNLLEEASARLVCEQYLTVLERAASDPQASWEQLVGALPSLPGVRPSARVASATGAAITTDVAAGSGAAITADSAADETVEAVRALWEELLEQPVGDLDADFFSLGGYSFLATRLVARLRADLDVEVSLQDFFEHCTVRELADLVAQRRDAGTQPLDPDTVEALLDRVEQMSDEEVARLLEQAD